MSKAADALWAKYRPFVGKVVTITAPTYKARGTDSDLVSITGLVKCLAWRETGIMNGSAYDMVIWPDDAPARTIALSRIIECHERAALGTGSMASDQDGPAGGPYSTGQVEGGRNE